MFQQATVGVMLAMAAMAQPQTGQALPQAPTRMNVKLTSEISTSRNQPGDKVTAMVLQPGGASTSIVTGTLKECQRKGVAVETAVLSIEFDKWHVRGQEVPIHGTLVSTEEGDEGASDGRLQAKKNNAAAALQSTQAVANILGRGRFRLPNKKTTAIVLGSTFTAGLVAGRFTSTRPDITIAEGTELTIRTQ